MKKVLLWGMGICFKQNVNMIKYHEMLRHFEVVGVTSNTEFYEKFYGYKYIHKKQLNHIEFDIVIVMVSGKLFNEVLKEVISLNIPKENIFNYKVLRLQKFDINRYINLKRNIPSIFANNCWGGLHMIV